MTEMRERIARAIYDKLEGPVANQDFARQLRQWDLAKETADAVLAEIAEPDEAMVQAGGASIIYPSVYMGGVPEGAKRQASRAWRAMIAKARKKEGEG